VTWLIVWQAKNKTFNFPAFYSLLITTYYLVSVCSKFYNINNNNCKVMTSEALVAGHVSCMHGRTKMSIRDLKVPNESLFLTAFASDWPKLVMVWCMLFTKLCCQFCTSDFYYNLYHDFCHHMTSTMTSTFSCKMIAVNHLHKTILGRFYFF